MKRSKRQIVSFIVGFFSSLPYVSYAWCSDEIRYTNFETQLDALLIIHPYSTRDLEPALAFIKTHEKDTDLESEMRQSKYFVKTEEKVKYYINPDKYGMNTYFSIDDDYYIYIFYDSTAKEVIEKYSAVMIKKTEQEFEIRRN